MHARRTLPSLPRKGTPCRGLHKRPAELKQLRSPAPVPLALSVPENNSSALEGPGLGRLLSTGTVNGHVVKVLYDNGSPINFVCKRLSTSLNVKSQETDFAANMPDGRSHILAETTESLNVVIGAYQERMRFAICNLSAYDLILGKKWRDDKDATVNSKNNKISFVCNNKNITIDASRMGQDDFISRQRLARHFIQKASVFAIYLQSNDPLSAVNVNAITMGEGEAGGELRSILTEYADVFPDELPDGLPPQRSHNFSIKLAEDAQPRRSGIYRLAKTELEALKSQLAVF